MQKRDGYQTRTGGTWSEIGHHGWEGELTLETTLRDALDDFDDGGDTGELYQYIDVEALVDVLSPQASRGASEVRFDYGKREVKISQDGVVSIR